MKQRFIFVLIFLGCLLIAINMPAQRVISGILSDESNGEVIIGAIVTDSSGRYGVTSQDGVFTIKTAHDQITFHYPGYTDLVWSVPMGKDTFIRVFMPRNILLEEVVIRNTIKKDINVGSLSTEQLYQIPALGGKPDVNRALQVLPGIKSTTEASGLLTVRGGDPGQNQYLIDNIPLTYVNHLGGFASVFNPDIINKLDVYKGAFPSKYGGRLSSIIDITHTSGNQFKRKSNVSIGLTDISFTTEGPLKSDKWTYILSGRKTVYDAYLMLASGLSRTNNYLLSYGYHDVNSKITWRPNTRNTMHLGFYYGDDYLNYWLRKSNDIISKNKLSTIWGNLLLAGNWRHSVRPGITNNLRLAYTRYRMNENNKSTYLGNNDISNKYRSLVGSIILKDDVNYSINHAIQLDAGFASTLSSFKPLSYSGTNPSIQSVNPAWTSENVLYAELDMKPGARISIKPGLRTVLYTTKGFSDVSWEPRLKIDWEIIEDLTFNTSFMRTKQFSQLLINPSDIMRNEVWIPSDGHNLPSSSEIATVGIAHKLTTIGLNYEIVAFYKKMNHLVTYKEGYSSLRGEPDATKRIERDGHGEAYGIENTLNWKRNKFAGTVSYAYTVANRQYAAINNGNRYEYDFSRPHTFTAFGSYKFSKKIEFNASWTYQSGLPFTPAVGKIQYPVQTADGLSYYEAILYGARNSGRMKPYHRLDVGMNLYKKTKRGRDAKWNFSVYNAYNRQNPYVYYYNDNDGSEIFVPEQGRETANLKLYQLSYFTFIPTASYTLYFSQDDQLKPRKKKSFKNWLEGK